MKIGYCFTGSFCTFSKSIEALEELVKSGHSVTPIMSQNAYSTDTRFGDSEEIQNKIISITGNSIIHTIEQAEPIGPKKLFDVLAIVPCTGNSLAKLAAGIADTSVTMAAKSHLRNSRPVVIGISTNDALGAAAKNIGNLMNYKNFYFVPFGMDNCVMKPKSMVCDFSLVKETVESALKGVEISKNILTVLTSRDKTNIFNKYNIIVLVEIGFRGKCIRLDKIIDLKDITVSYGDNVILDKLNLYINEKEFITLLGPSGCGKTTTLRCIAGFVQPDSGDIVFEGKVINDVPPHKRKVNTIFQRYALFPHLNVYENIAFGPELQKKPKNEVRKTVAEMLSLVNLKGFEKRPISSLSGGQQQRVAIARALANRPHVLLLDEPLGALDLKLRKDMQKELKDIQKRLGITFIYVTHDQEEALSMSDTVVVMDKGKIQQIGTPEDIYNEPVNAFVADFIGESNIVDARMIRDYVVKFGGVVFDCLDSGFAPNEFVEAVVRPEDIDICDPGHKASLTGTITDVVFKGVFFEIFVDVGGFIWMVQTTDYHEVGKTVGMYIEPDAIHIMKRSEYSGEFGDYSTFSDEMDHISDADYSWEDENE